MNQATTRLVCLYDTKLIEKVADLFSLTGQYLYFIAGHVHLLIQYFYARCRQQAAPQVGCLTYQRKSFPIYGHLGAFPFANEAGHARAEQFRMYGILSSSIVYSCAYAIAISVCGLTLLTNKFKACSAHSVDTW